MYYHAGYHSVVLPPDIPVYSAFFNDIDFIFHIFNIIVLFIGGITYEILFVLWKRSIGKCAFLQQLRRGAAKGPAY